MPVIFDVFILGSTVYHLFLLRTLWTMDP
jgi:hypothetical protein